MIWLLKNKESNGLPSDQVDRQVRSVRAPRRALSFLALPDEYPGCSMDHTERYHKERLSDIAADNADIQPTTGNWLIAAAQALL